MNLPFHKTVIEFLFTVLRAPKILAQFNKSREDFFSTSTVKRRQNKSTKQNGLYTWRLKKCIVEWWVKIRSYWFKEKKKRVFVHRNSKEQMIDSCIVPIVKHGGNHRRWFGALLLKKNNNKIIKDNMTSSGTRLISKKFRFRHDNYPKHCSNLCKDWTDWLFERFRAEKSAESYGIGITIPLWQSYWNIMK